MKVMLASAAALAALALAGCGDGGHATTTVSTVQADAVISQQVRDGLKQTLSDQTGATYDVAVNCIVVGGNLARFKCSASATNTADPADYSTALVDVTCEAEVRNCVWQVR